MPDFVKVSEVPEGPRRCLVHGEDILRLNATVPGQPPDPAQICPQCNRAAIGGARGVAPRGGRPPPGLRSAPCCCPAVTIPRRAQGGVRSRWRSPLAERPPAPGGGAGT